MLLLGAIATAQVCLLAASAAPAAPNSEAPPVALMSTEEEPAERCSWQWEGLASGWECRENLNYFSITNDCPSFSDSHCPISLAVRSAEPPGV